MPNLKSPLCLIGGGGEYPRGSSFDGTTCEASSICTLIAGDEGGVEAAGLISTFLGAGGRGVGRGDTVLRVCFAACFEEKQLRFTSRINKRMDERVNGCMLGAFCLAKAKAFILNKKYSTTKELLCIPKMAIKI
jgi:hypothetical protein